MKLEGGEPLVLKILRDLQGDSTDYVEDAHLASATKMNVTDVRDGLETLEGKGFVERTRLTDGFSGYITPKGKQALRLTEQIQSPKPISMESSAKPATQGETGASSQPAPTQKPAGPICLFYSYSHKDEALRDELQDLVDSHNLFD